MKNAIVFLLLIVSTNSYSQSLDSFFGMKFGCSPDSVKKVMLAKPGTSLMQGSRNDFLMFSGLKFAGRNTERISFSFINNKLHTGKVGFKSNLESKTLELYNEIKDELNQKYFKTKQDYEIYKYPFTKGDGHFETAVSSGKASIASFWEFKNPKAKVKEDNNSISLQITETFLIALCYQDGVLIGQAIDNDNKKNFKDY